MEQYRQQVDRSGPLLVLYRSVPFRYRSIVPLSKNRRNLVGTLLTRFLVMALKNVFSPFPMTPKVMEHGLGTQNLLKIKQKVVLVNN